MVAIPELDRSWRLVVGSACGPGEYTLSRLTEDEANTMFVKAASRFPWVKLYCGDELVNSYPSS